MGTRKQVYLDMDYIYPQPSEEPLLQPFRNQLKGFLYVKQVYLDMALNPKSLQENFIGTHLKVPILSRFTAYLQVPREPNTS